MNTLKRQTLWVALNLLLFVPLYVGYMYDSACLQNMGVTIIWLYIVLMLLVSMVDKSANAVRKQGHTVHRYLNYFVSLAILLTLSIFELWCTAGFFAVAAILELEMLDGQYKL